MRALRLVCVWECVYARVWLASERVVKWACREVRGRSLAHRKGRERERER